MRAPAKAGKGRKGGRERRERWRQTASPGKSSILSENHRKRGLELHYITSKTKVLQLPAAGVRHGSVKTKVLFCQILTKQYEYQTQPKYAHWPC